jgi:hypothetical protein
MSNKLVQRIWNDAPYIGEKMLALLVLAEWANDDGFCAVSPEQLAHRVRVTEACALELLQEFIEDGALRLATAATESQPAFYQMLPRCWSNDPHPATVKKTANLKMNSSREWLEKRADLEDQAIINIGPRNEE